MSDWIKMRSGLLTNPRVIRMAKVLLSDPEFLEWLGVTDVTSRDERVTKRYLQPVTRIVVGALLPTWSAANDSVTRDGIVRHATSQDIDETAGVPGFGRALMAVEWLADLPDGNGVQFVNFEEHNRPEKERSLTSKSHAERQAAYRARKKQEAEEAAARDAEGDTPSDARRDVTVTSQSDDRREEKRREKNTSPSLRSGEGANKSRRPPRNKREEKTLAAYLEECRAEGRKPLPPNHSIREYCAGAGISEEMLQVAWVVFRRQYTEDPNYSGKRQKDWPAHFANAVRKRWAELWYVESGSGEVKWTSTGALERAALDAKARAREQQHEPA